MSDSEEDYMSDKLLQNCEKEDIRPGLIFNRSKKRDHELYKKTVSSQKKPKLDTENEIREQGLQTAISSENKGFKLLEKMGYKAGTSLGKSEKGVTQPIRIEVKLGNKGLGHKTLLEERKRKKTEVNINTERNFKASKIEKNELHILKKDLYKAQKACEDLDFRNEKQLPDKNFFWTKHTFLELTKKKKKEEDEDSSEEDEDEVEEEETKEVLAEQLHDLLEYLRNNYFYCIYCVARATDIEDLNSFCPGISRTDHDDDI
ncbi:G patch domain-containing protein 11 [Agrilus planipennis]|uniref:G patch domain-containing protein 11 n=1 Tax=Agrilus planipennis TaxID=224129 RepID=A0A1W4X2M6_AGRPL|nr:G patch domain-containing protein 11 [Agrilus planipennis]